MLFRYSLRLMNLRSPTSFGGFRAADGGEVITEETRAARDTSERTWCGGLHGAKWAKVPLKRVT